MISLNLSFDITNVVVLESKIFFRVTSSISENSALNLMQQVLLLSSASAFYINSKTVDTNDQRMLPKKHLIVFF